MRYICIFALFLLISACSMPRIIVLEDPLTAEEHNDLGVVYYKQAKFELAEQEYLKAVKKNKKFALPYYNLGNLYYAKGDKKKSEQYFRKALERDQKNPDIMNNLAFVLYETDALAEAERLISEALKIKDSDEYQDTLLKIQQKKQKKGQ